MSLQAKIIAWFVMFASTIVVLFVLGDYYQSTRALRVALEARAGTLAQQTAGDIGRHYAQAEAELLGLGYAVAAGVDGDALVVPAAFSSIRVIAGERTMWEGNAAPYPVRSDGCAPLAVGFSVPVRSAAGVEHRVEATMPAVYFFERIRTVSARLGRNGLTSVMSTADGSLVYDAGCTIRSSQVPHELEADIGAQVVAAGAEAGTGLGRLRVLDLPAAEDTRERFVALAPAVRPQWTAVVAVDVDEFAAPFAAVRTQYLLVMIGLITLAMLLVLRFMRNDMRRLTAISNAADAIGHGRFDVWLPPPTSDEVGRVSLALGRMVNRLSSTLHQMEISRAMAAVGELATYLSHEIRNPLSSIRLNLQMLRRDLEAGTVPEDGEELVTLCLDELQRLDDVVKTVLDVGRTMPAGQGGSCDAHSALAEVIRVMDPKFAEHRIDVELRLGSTESRIAMDGRQFKSIVINLLLNSVDALADAPEKRIGITTELYDPGVEEAYLELTLTDSGPGVPAHLRERIFEPFFTTKASGNGIGLATALRMVQECGGLLRCSKAPGWTGGAEFVLQVPLVRTREADTGGRRRRRAPRGTGAAPEPVRLRGADVRGCRAGPPVQCVQAGPGHLRHPHAGHERVRPAAHAARARAADEGGARHRVRRHADGGRRHEAGRVRLPDEAAGPGRPR
jgi:signal transduction histidine kinase